MKLRSLGTVGFALVAVASARPESARMTFAGQLSALAADIANSLKDDPRVKDQTLTLGEFDPLGEAASSNHGAEIRRLLKERLGSSIRDGSNHTLRGSFSYVPGDEKENKGLKVLLVIAKIVDARDKEVCSFFREINDTDDIFRVLGLTGGVPDPAKADIKQRNEAAKQAHAKPNFELCDGHRVHAPGKPEWSVGILRKESAAGHATPVTPTNVLGKAVAPIPIGSYFEIELANADEKDDAIALVTIDGLDVVNAFNADKGADGKKIKYGGYFLPRRQSGQPATVFVVRGWMHTVDAARHDNVFSFKVGKLGEGAATELKSRGTVGVVTVQFKNACEPNGVLGRGASGETQKGEPLEQKMVVKHAKVGDVQSTVTIRYNQE